MYLRILCKIHVSDSCLSIYISQGPLQDPCLRIHVSASSNLRLLCKIHVSDSCLSIHVSASIYISGSSARSMSLESQHLCISGFSTRSMSSDSCLSIHYSNMDPLQDPRLWAHVSASLYLRNLCKIHVSGSVNKHPYVSQDPLQDPCLRIHVSASICI